MSDKQGAAEAIPSAAITHPRLVLLSSVGLLLMAALVWNHLPRSESPRVEPAEAIVSLVFPGATAVEVEQQVLRAVEPVILGVQDIEWVESSAQPGLALLHARFADGTDMPLTYERIRGALMAHRSDWPSAVLESEVHGLSTDMRPALVIAVKGYRSSSELSRVARDLQSTLLATTGVVGVDLWGERSDAVRVKVDPTELAQHGIAVSDVVQAIRTHDALVPAGMMNEGKRDAVLTVEHRVLDVPSVAAIPIAPHRQVGSAPAAVHLSDVASVERGNGPSIRHFFYGSTPAVALEVRFRPGDNATEIGERVELLLAHQRTQLPKGITLGIAHNLQEWANNALSAFWESLLEGVLLVMGIITLGLGVRAAMIVAGVLPLAVCGAVIGLYGFGFGLDQISIAGLIVALGLLVDDAVVVTESIVRLRTDGLDAVRASVQGTARVFRANNATTAIACAAFFPLFFMGGMVGSFLRGLPTAVIIALLASLAAAQMFTPWAATWLLRKPLARSHHHDAHEHPSVLVYPVQRASARVLPWVIAHPWTVTTISCVLFAASLTLLPIVGIQFFPKSDKPAFFVTVEMPKGTRLAETAHKVQECLRELEKIPGIRDASGVAGQGYPEVFFGGRLGRPRAADFGDIFIRTVRGADTAQIAVEARRRLSYIPGARTFVEELYSGPYVPHPVSLRVFGRDYDELRIQAGLIAKRLRETPGAVNVAHNMEAELPTQRAIIDADAAFNSGLAPVQIALAARALYGEDTLVEAYRGNDKIEVVVEPTQENRSTSQLAGTRMRSATGRTVSLDATAALVGGSSVAELKRRNSERMVEVTADLAPGVVLSDVMTHIRPWLETQTWPAGYRVSAAGAQEETENGFVRLGIAALFAVVVIAVILVWMFDSFSLCLAVLLALPFGVSGALVGLWVSGNAFGMNSFLGLLSLLAVYVNHKVYFIDRMLSLRSGGMDLSRAICQAGQERVPPVVLTALTAVLSLLPLAFFGGPVWNGFSWTCIFGLLASIPLSLVLLPALIVLVERLRRSSRSMFAPGSNVEDALDAPGLLKTPPARVHDQ